MSEIINTFPTRIYQARLGGGSPRAFIDELRTACLAIAQEDGAGQAWSEDADYKGYTSYASLKDLPDRNPTFAELCERLEPHMLAFAQALDYDLRGHKPVVDSIWINVMEPGGRHGWHIHPNSVLSGTIYVDAPDGASAIRFEDPRLAMMMAAPPRKTRAAPKNRNFLDIRPKRGLVVLWESWLRHEVPVNRADGYRISVSFNAVLA